MSKNDDGKGIGRLWGSSVGRKEPPKSDKVLPMERPPDSRMPADRAYHAFDLRDNAERLEIRRAAEPSRYPAYHSLLDMSDDRFHNAAFTLIYTFQAVTVKGRNLAPIVHAINFGECARITEFNTREYDKPDAGEPLIESIEFIAADAQLNAGKKP
jgi:hypothetical protein